MDVAKTTTDDSEHGALGYDYEPPSIGAITRRGNE